MSRILNVINYFWKLGFNEENPDIYVKTYFNSYSIAINMAKEIVDYGNKIRVSDEYLKRFSQKNFIIMESLDRILTKGYKPESIHLGKSQNYDYAVENTTNEILFAISCKMWEEDYEEVINAIKTDHERLSSFFNENKDIKYFCIYTSRMKAGLIEYKYLIFPRIINKEQFGSDYPARVESYNQGLFEEKIQAYAPILEPNLLSNRIQKKTDLVETSDFEVIDGMLVKYKGNQNEVIIPHGVKRLNNSLFWNYTSLEKLTIPDSVISLGGDTFYFCTNLIQLTIPQSVEIMGDNPFANCPKLILKNKSPYFILENGALYNKEKTRLIYYSMREDKTTFNIPEGVISVGKHAFYNCQILEEVVISPSVKIMENNPLSNCSLLSLENNSPHFVVKDGALYNKNMTTLFYYEIKNKSQSLEIPNGVKIIGRHSFFNCKNLKHLSIPSSVKIIGYNPFTGCSSLSVIENNSPNYMFENGALYDISKTELIFYLVKNSTENFTVPNTVKKIGRSAFYGCTNLKHVTIPESVTIIERSAFANCTNLTDVTISKNILSLAEWAFYNCSKLAEITIPEHATVGRTTFLNCPVKISYTPC